MQAPALPPIPAEGSSAPERVPVSKPSRMRRWSSQLPSLCIRRLLCKLCTIVTCATSPCAILLLLPHLQQRQRQAFVQCGLPL